MGSALRKALLLHLGDLHLYPFLKGLMGRQNRSPTIVIVWSILLASIFSLLWVKIDNAV
uniref:Uncharacterized protein n=2 Tax=Oryza brachyantha TaxID=4533 RepID=J3M4C0_ORYBR